MKIYTYKQCGTCKKATKWLSKNNLAFEEHPIRETPPTHSELQTMLDAYNGEIKRLFNTSGMDYRSLGMKDKLPTLSKDEALELLTNNGNLVKRPFVLSDKLTAVGFKEADWEKALL